MSSSKLKMLIWTLLVIISTRTHSRFTTFTSSPSLSRQIRAEEKSEITDLIPQPEICKEFVESKASPRGSKAASAADIFYNLSIGRDFATPGRKPAKSYVFQSPNYPRDYPMNIDCFKLIRAPSEEHRIYLQILRPFAVEPDAQCFLDFLEVRDGAFGFSPLIGRFCSRLPPPEEMIRSSGRYLWLRFRSDNTLRHAGFRATYHFEKVENIQEEYEGRLSVIHLVEDEQWTMRSGFLTSKLEYISSEERQLPLEAVFDIRSPPGTNILLFVHHFQVPQVASWSCDSHFLAKQKSTHYCDHNSRPIAMEPDSYTDRPPNILQVRQYTKIVPDPTSYMDGIHTYAEIYTDGQTLAESSPPCPRVDRFCIATAHSDLSGGDDVSNGGSGSAGSDASSDKDDERPKRQFVVKSPRLVIRLVVAKPSKPPPHEPNGEESVMKNGMDPYETDKSLDLFTMLPNFTFTLTTLSPRVDDACAPNQRACDESYCIQIGHWCDGVVNCPLGQDEGDAACNPEKANFVENIDETDTMEVLYKDRTTLEREEEEKADMEKHAAIIGSISLILIVITVICMFFAIRRKRKEANHHVIEIKLPPELDSPQLSSTNSKNGTKNASSASLQAAKLLNADVIIDMDELENDPLFSSSGDALLGRDSGSNQKGIFTNHNWERKASPAIARAFGLNSNLKSPATKSSKSRNVLLQHQQIQHQPKQQRNTWQSDVNLIQHSQTHHSRGKLIRGDSAKTADELTNLRYLQSQLPPRMNNLPLPIPPTTSTKIRQSRYPRPPQSSNKVQEETRNRGHHRRHHHGHHRHHNRHQKSERNQVQRQKTFNTEIPDQETHVLNCRLLTGQQRTRSLATSRFRLYDSREIVDPYGVEFSSSRSSSTHSTSSSRSTESTSSTKSSSTTSCSSKTSTSVSYNPQKKIQQGFRGYENLAPYSVRLKAFRSMPDVARATGTTVIPSAGGRAGGGYQLAVGCGHKDCRDYYRLQALRSDLQVEHNRRSNKISLDKPALLREREIELTPSSEEGDVPGRMEEGPSICRNPGDKLISLPNPIASDAYSVHGLSDAVSVESSKDGSGASHSAFTDESNGNGRHDSYSSTDSPLSPRPPSRVSSTNRSLSRAASLSKRMDSPSSSRSRVRVHPTAPNLLVYEYEA